MLVKTEERCSRIGGLHFRPVGVGWCTPLLSAENYGEDDFESFEGGDQDPNLDEEEVGCLIARCTLQSFLCPLPSSDDDLS